MIIRAPQKFVLDDTPSVFLAGSIEMGAAENWQARAERELRDFIVLNPRRDDWDSSWVQSIDNTQFREQVEWELYAMDVADLILMHFEPSTKSPVTLLELGLHAQFGKLIVHCPEGFWRKGNVDIVCKRFNIAQAQTLDQLLSVARSRLGFLNGC